MSNKIYELIAFYEQKGDFTYADATEEMLSNAEKRLEVPLPVEYKQFLKTFGQGGIGGIDILGIGKNNAVIFESETLKYRTYGLPRELIVIENCDEWVYCLNTNSGKIVLWSRGCTEYQEVYDNFTTYLRDRVNDVLENM